MRYFILIALIALTILGIYFLSNFSDDLQQVSDAEQTIDTPSDNPLVQKIRTGTANIDGDHFVENVSFPREHDDRNIRLQAQLPGKL